jgi:hypothetical protein
LESAELAREKDYPLPYIKIKLPSEPCRRPRVKSSLRDYWLSVIVKRVVGFEKAKGSLEIVGSVLSFRNAFIFELATFCKVRGYND